MTERLFYAVHYLTKPRRLQWACTFAGIDPAVIPDLMAELQTNGAHMTPFLKARFAIGDPADLVRPVIVKHGPGAYVVGAIHLADHAVSEANLAPHLASLTAAHGGRWEALSLICQRRALPSNPYDLPIVGGRNPPR
jgi:hypothetical protein